MDLDGSGPDDGVTLGLTAVASLILEVKVPQVERGQTVLLLRPLEDATVLLCPLPGEGWGVETPGRSAGDEQI